MRNVSTPTTRRCRCSTSGKTRTDDYGPTCSTIGHSPVARRRRRSTSTRPIERGASRGASGPLARADAADAYQAASKRALRAGPRPARSSRSPAGRMRRRYFFDLARLNKGRSALRRSPHRWHCSPSSARSTDCHPPNADASASERSSPWSMGWHLVARALRQGLANGKTGKAIAYSLNAWDAPRSLPQRWPSVHEQTMRERRCARLLPAGVTGPSPLRRRRRRAAANLHPIETAKLNDVDPLAWLPTASLACRITGQAARRTPAWTRGDFRNSAPRLTAIALSTNIAAAFSGRVPLLGNEPARTG